MNESEARPIVIRSRPRSMATGSGESSFSNLHSYLTSSSLRGVREQPTKNSVTTMTDARRMAVIIRKGNTLRQACITHPRKDSPV